MNNQIEPPLYCFFTKVDDDTLLGHLFNQVIEALAPARIVSSPENTTVDGWNNKEKAFLFYEMCLTEQYLHSIIDNLLRWEKLTRKYAKEFHYSWKYYALSNRMDLIKEFGGEEHDYNEDGSVRTDFSDEELIDETIIAELLDTSGKNIFISTMPTDCLKVCYMIIHAGTFCIIDFLKEKTGKKVKTYRMGEYGEMIENDWTDEAIQKAEKQLQHENIADVFWSVLLDIYGLICHVQKLSKTEDNKEFFQKLPKVIDNIFNLRIPLMKLPEIDIAETNE